MGKRETVWIFQIRSSLNPTDMAASPGITHLVTGRFPADEAAPMRRDRRSWAAVFGRPATPNGEWPTWPAPGKN